MRTETAPIASWSTSIRPSGCPWCADRRCRPPCRLAIRARDRRPRAIGGSALSSRTTSRGSWAAPTRLSGSGHLSHGPPTIPLPLLGGPRDYEYDFESIQLRPSAGLVFMLISHVGIRVRAILVALVDHIRDAILGPGSQHDRAEHDGVRLQRGRRRVRILRRPSPPAHLYEAAGPAVSNSRSSDTCQHEAATIRAEYAASLEPWKLYRLLSDPEAARLGQIRIVDESGEDFLYPTEWFKAVRLPAALARLFAAARD